MAKYKNKKITLDGITFDSRKEANRYRELKLLERAGEIHTLELQKNLYLFLHNMKKLKGMAKRDKGSKTGRNA